MLLITRIASLQFKVMYSSQSQSSIPRTIYSSFLKMPSNQLDSFHVPLNLKCYLNPSTNHVSTRPTSRKKDRHTGKGSQGNSLNKRKFTSNSRTRTIETDNTFMFGKGIQNKSSRDSSSKMGDSKSILKTFLRP